MLYVSQIYTNKPLEYVNEVQKLTYEVLEKLNIKYERVETDDAVTMDDCFEINKKLNMETVKTLFLCNRQKTEFYLFVTTSDKKFSSKSFGAALNISRVSFANEELMHQILGTNIGATTIFSVLIDNGNKINIIIDKDVLNNEYYGCSDGTVNGYMKLKTSDVINKVLPYSKHKEVVIKI